MSRESKINSLAPSSSTALPLFFLKKFTLFRFLSTGYCEKPALILSQAQQQLTAEQQQELSAEKFYQKQGYSIEQALHKALGKFYQQCSLDDQKRWRAFFVALANGNVEISIAAEFAQRLALPFQHKMREKLLEKILVAHEVQATLPISLPWRLR